MFWGRSHSPNPLRNAVEVNESALNAWTFWLEKHGKRAIITYKAFVINVLRLDLIPYEPVQRFEFDLHGGLEALIRLA